MKSSDTLTSAIKLAVWNILSGVHTALPGRVESYDHTGPSIEAKPLIKKLYRDGVELSLPVIVSVPVVFMRTARFKFTFPLEQGDGVLLIFAERSIDNWLSRGEEVAPQVSRKFDLSDAIAIPGLWGLEKGLAIEDPDNFELALDDVNMHTDGMDFEITNGQVTISTDGANFEITNGQATIQSDNGTVDINNGNLTVDL